MKRPIFSAFLLLVALATAFSQQPLTVRDNDGRQLLLQLNARTGSAHRVSGQLPNIRTYGFQPKDITQATVETLSRKFFSAYANILRIPSAQMKLKKAETDGKLWFVSYGQSVSNVPVYGAEIGYTVNEAGDIVAAGADAYPQVSISTVPQVTAAVAEAGAKKAFAYDSAATEKGCTLTIYPKENQDSTEMRLAWEIRLARIFPLDDRIYFVDAQTGNILDSKKAIVEGDNLRGQVSASYWPVLASDPTQQAGFKTTHIKVWNYLGQLVADVNSDANGNYSAGYLATTYYYVLFNLQNDYVQSRDAANSGNAIAQGTWCLPGVVNQNWGATDGTSARWLASAMHDFFKTTFAYASMDYQMGAYINEGAGYNGAADGSNIMFGSQSGQLWADRATVSTMSIRTTPCSTSTAVGSVIQTLENFKEPQWTKGLRTILPVQRTTIRAGRRCGDWQESPELPAISQ